MKTKYAIRCFVFVTNETAETRVAYFRDVIKKEIVAVNAKSYDLMAHIATMCAHSVTNSKKTFKL